MDKKRNPIVGKMLGGKAYTASEEPHWWNSQKYLPYFSPHIVSAQIPFIDPVRHKQALQENRIDPESLPLNDFPLIEDFEVVLWRSVHEDFREDSEEQSIPWYKVYFFSASTGFLATFLHADFLARDLCADDFRLPSGDFGCPYFDFDEGWIMLIAEWEDFVYILAGSYEDVSIRKKGYRTWYKVEKQRYYSQWENAVHLCRQTFQKE